MDFLKKHYEKIILCVVLLLLAGVSAYLPIKAGDEKRKDLERRDSIVNPPVKAVTATDISTNEFILNKVKLQTKVEISGTHNLFNPVEWQQKPDGSMIKITRGSEVGVRALVITNIVPLNIIATFDRVDETPEAMQYVITVIRETEKERSARKITASLLPKNGNKVFSLIDVKGPTNNPTGVLLKLPLEPEPVLVTKTKPYSKVLGYSMDLKYDPELKTFKGLKVKDEFTISGDAYIVVAITPDEAVVSAKSNRKQTTLKFASGAK